MAALAQMLRLVKGTARRYSCGLFERQILESPGGFGKLTKETIAEASNIVDEIVKSVNSSRTVLLFDELSNALCRTADLAECIRLLHPNNEYVEQAQKCCFEVSTFVEKLNTNKELYVALDKVINSNDYHSLEQDTQRNVSSLMHDFEISGIHLSGGEREKVVDLNQTILSGNHMFMSNCNSPIYINKTGLPTKLLNSFPHEGDHILIDHFPHLCSDSDIRELSYRAYYSTASSSQSRTLDNLLTAKFELASLVGHKSFAHRTLKDSMAGSPEVVLEFLNALSDKLYPLAAEEAKEALSHDSSANVLLPWNIAWLTQQAKTKYFNQLSLEGMNDFFPLDSCMNGLGLLFANLFNVDLKEETIKQGEVWHDSVKKYSFVDQHNETTLGHIYCDLHYRPNKLQSDCLFTIQGHKELRDGSHQMPVSTLNLSISGGCLPQLAVENLFHEMGHATHSILGRTRYQNLSGTRCPTDFAEVPSNLMELFLHDERVLKSFAKNSIGRVIPNKYTSAFRLTGNVFPALSAQSQILYSVMDQVFHSSHPLQKPPVEIFSDLHQRYSPIHYVADTASYLRFTHLSTYAGKYYSYLWSRAVANLIWRQYFKEDPFSQRMGQIYRDKTLAHGGGECPNVLVENLLGYRPSINEMVDAYYQEIVELKEKIASIQGTKH